jgi:DNA repair photolyase
VAIDKEPLLFRPLVFEELTRATFILNLEEHLHLLLPAKELKASSALGRSAICDYCLNPYVGCEHGCLYCYARFSGRLVGRGLLDWGNYLYFKSNIIEVLGKDISKKTPGEVYLSSITDPYQPIEEKLQLTRRALVLLASNKRFSVTIQTKSPLVLRDVDILKEIRDRCTIGFTIAMWDDWAGVFEPRAPPPSARLNGLKELSHEGFKTYAFIGPIIPSLDDPLEIISKIEDYVDHVYLDRLNLRPGVWASLRPTFDRLGLTQRVWAELQGDGQYYRRIRDAVSEYCTDKGLKLIPCY